MYGAQCESPGRRDGHEHTQRVPRVHPGPGYDVRSRMPRALMIVVWIVIGAVPARAETIALLPLDADKRLEVYGQPVAAEIGRALKEAGIDVVVVGAKMDVPARAELIVDGTIKAAKGD